MTPAEWWGATERMIVERRDPSTVAGGDSPGWLASLTRACAALLEFRLPDAEKFLGECASSLPDDPWRRVHALLESGVKVRRADAKVLAELEGELAGLVGGFPEAERETAARGWHLLGTLRMRLGRAGEAEEALERALSLVEEAPSKVWILDGFGQALLGEGAWGESRRVLEAVAERKERLDDPIGIAITLGHLALANLTLGEPERAAGLMEKVAAKYGERLPPLSLLRVRTMLLQAYLDSGRREEAKSQSEALEDLLGKISDRKHYLVGYAAVALARSAALEGLDEKVVSCLRQAGGSFSLSDQVPLLRYWEARLLPGSVSWAEWPARMEELFRGAGSVTESEILTLILLAERASSAGRTEEMRSCLDRASERAAESNNRLWVERVDREYRRMNPKGLTDRLVRRFSGRGLDELAKTKKERVTVVFADLVSFTPRTQELSPEEVMDTVRSLFELTVPLLGRHKVQPLNYLGDGLLAVCQGEGHERRALEFALALVRRASRVTLVRRALGESWGMDLRAGLATGPVVLGLLGNHFKMEYAAIGLTTNLASRLQGAANPGEVVCAFETAGSMADRGSVESLTLKGVAEPVKAVRFAAGC